MTPANTTLRSLLKLVTRARAARLVPLVGAAAVGAYAGQTQLLNAHHENPSVHFRSMHTSGNGANEIYCIDKTNASQVDVNDAQSKINAVLRVDSTSADWQNSDGSNRIYFESVYSETATHDCDALTQGWRDQVIVEYHMANNNADAPCSSEDNISCVTHSTQLTSGGHTDYKYSNVYVDYDHIYPGLSLRRHVINHETGHALGLKDPPPCNDANGNWIPSVMHSNYYCGQGNPEWPTQGDRNSVTSIANQFSEGGGGK